MKIIEIPVSRFSKRFIESEYDFVTVDGTPVILLSSDSLLYHYLCSKTKNNTPYRTSTQRMMSDTIAVRVQDKVAAQINKNRIYLAHFLNEMHREELYKIIYKTPHLLQGSGIEKEPEIKKLIESWCDMHHIELDIDINYDTIRRGLTRYVAKRQKRQENVGHNSPSIVHPKCPRKYRFSVQKIEKLYTQEELDSLTEMYIQKNPSLFKFKTQNTQNLFIIEELKSYVYYYIGGYTTQYIAKTLKKSTKTCRYRRNRFAHRLRTFPPIL